MLGRTILAACAMFATIAGNTAAFDEDAARVAFNNHCRTCHSVKKDDHRLGPSMYGIYGASGGQAKGYRGYSGSLTGVTWDERTLDRFIADPASVATSTNMIFPPVADPDERQRIIDFLKSLRR